MSILLESVTPRGRVRYQRGRTVPRLDHPGRELAARNIRLAVGLARKFVTRRPMPLDEAVAAAFLGLTEAAARFSGEIPFTSYAPIVITSKLAEAADRHFKAADHTRGFTQDAEENLPDRREAEPDRRAAAQEAVGILRRVLKPRDFQALWDVYALGRPASQIADEQQVSRQAVSDRLKWAAARARKLLPDLARE